ncbi:SWI/SNF-related matrix-associated actin-dependent regulator of chromatin subfamily D [Pancytospora epiphaga]|nr:SWI/SNF-related matrix-associated actin-dependent regulator of chromatin subfamily D [Pancytospora epiphaga]
MFKDYLQRLESRIDKISLHRRLLIEAEHLKRIKTTKTLRIYTNPSNGFIKISTRVLTETGIEDNTPFWDLVKRVVITANTDIPLLNEEGGEVLGASSTDDDSTEIFEWTRDCDGQAFSIPIRSSYKRIQLLLKLANTRQIYRLCKDLRELLEKFADSKPNIIKDLYKYINNNKLNDYATAIVTCDEKLETILKMKQFNFNDIGGIIDGLVEPLGYCVINVNMNEMDIWDLNIECDDLGNMPVVYPKIVQEIEKKIEANKASCQKTTERIGVLEEFLSDPLYFINRKIALESECLGVQTGFYDDLAVQTAVFELLKEQHAE